MKKTISISIGGMSFQIEEDAYERLDNYLKSIKQHFSSYPESTEIVSDIEDRIADQFSAKTGLAKIVGLKTVEELILAMGTPEQMGGSERGSNFKAASGEQPKGRKLFRNADDVIIAGVCSGLAAYVGIDAVWVRLIFALSIFFGGFGILLYIILWIIVPEAKTDTEKMQMRGEAINLKNVEANIKERISEIHHRFKDSDQSESASAKASADYPLGNNAWEGKKKDRSGIKNALTAPFRALGALGRAVKNIFPLFARLLGVVITVAGVAAIAGLAVAAVSVAFNANSPYVDFPLREIAAGGLLYVAVISAFLVGFVPLVFLTLIGTSLAAYKSTFGKIGSIFLVGIWIAAIALTAGIGIRLAPQIESAVNTYQTQAKEEKVFALDDFSQVDLRGSYNAQIIPGPEFKIIARGTNRELEAMEIRKEGPAAVFGTRDNFNFCLFCIRKGANVEIHMPKLEKVFLSGASHVTASGFKAERLDLDFSGASGGDMEVDIAEMNARLSGASKARISGTSTQVSLKASGASQFDSASGSIRDAELDLSGASKAWMGNLQKLQVKASGASKVYYLSTEEIQQELSGASRIVNDQE